MKSLVILNFKGKPLFVALLSRGGLISKCHLQETFFLVGLLKAPSLTTKNEGTGILNKFVPTFPIIVSEVRVVWCQIVMSLVQSWAVSLPSCQQSWWCYHRNRNRDNRHNGIHHFLFVLTDTANSDTVLLTRQFLANHSLKQFKLHYHNNGNSTNLPPLPFLDLPYPPLPVKDENISFMLVLRQKVPRLTVSSWSRLKFTR